MKRQEKKVIRSKKIGESLSYTVEVTDKEGRVLQRISAPSRSYVQQWNQIINGQAGFFSEFRCQQISGATYSDARYSAETLRATAAIGDDTIGIRVGKGTTAVAITGYALESPCDEGTGLDQFEHQEMQFTEPSVAGSTCSFTITRTMINNSGATITGIKEIGCYIRFYVPILYPSAMGFRDVLPSALSIPDGGSIRVTYTLAVTV